MPSRAHQEEERGATDDEHDDVEQVAEEMALRAHGDPHGGGTFDCSSAGPGPGRAAGSSSRTSVDGPRARLVAHEQRAVVQRDDDAAFAIGDDADDARARRCSGIGFLSRDRPERARGLRDAFDRPCARLRRAGLRRAALPGFP